MKNVLFVDDDPEIISSTKRLLFSMKPDWLITFSESGAEALERLKEKVYDVVITDIRMPGLTGIDLLTHVRQHHPHTVRIALSGHADRDTSLKASGLVHQYLSKPCPIESILNAVQQALRTNSLIPDEQLRSLIARLKTIPSQPQAYLQIVTELKKPAPSIGTVGNIITQDASMSAKILQLVNSAFFGLPQTVIDPAHATVLLGLETVRDLVLSVGIFAQFEAGQLQPMGLSNVWDHSQRTGGLAKAIAQDLGADRNQVNDSYIAGLLHDVGKLILAENLPQPYREIRQRAAQEGQEMVNLEWQRFGATHAQVGAYLFGLWGLSWSVVNAVAGHHSPSQSGSDPSPVTLAVHAANVIDHQSHPDTAADSPPPQVDAAFLDRCGGGTQFAAWKNLAF